MQNISNNNQPTHNQAAQQAPQRPRLNLKRPRHCIGNQDVSIFHLVVKNPTSPNICGNNLDVYIPNKIMNKHYKDVQSSNNIIQISPR